MKILLIILAAITLNASCEYHIDRFNQSKTKLDLMIEYKSPYYIYIREKRKAIYHLENAERLCYKKDYYRTLIKFYKGIDNER